MPATTEGTKRYAERFKASAANGYFSQQQGLTMSSVGLGTYLGNPDAETDESYRAAMVRAVELGVNVIDSAINYRFQRSERAIAHAIRDLVAFGKASRDELVVATKAGYIAFETDQPVSPQQYFADNFVKTGIASPRDLVAGCHCMTPGFLDHQINLSLRNLGIDTLDVFYLHNPETQLSEIERGEFFKSLRNAFACLEAAAGSGKIGMYGLATWNAFRVPGLSPDFISIEDVVQCARDVAGDGHHFRAVQFPYNLAMTEAYSRFNQRIGETSLPMIEASQKLGLTVMASASIYQSQLTRNLPEYIHKKLPGLKTDTQRAIQFVRSTPGISVALVGMSKVQHVEENLFIRTVPTNPDVIPKMFDA